MDLNYPHRRWNPLTRDWVLVSPHRARRPWLGQVEKVPPENLPGYDPNCYLCPGNLRAEGVRNPDYTATFVFDNDFPALLPPLALPESARNPQPESRLNGIFTVQQAWGICRVVCFSPRHDLSIPELPLGEVETVVQTWIEQTTDLGKNDFIHYVQVFENKGAMMGASNPHPHSQIWATSMIPDEPAKELVSQQEYLSQNGSCLLCDYLQAELQSGERVICSNPHFTALVPFWAIWPYEVMLISNRHLASLPDLTSEETRALAELLQRVTARYDNLFEVSFPYSMGFHQAPVNGEPQSGWHFHAHYYPPLLRSATVRKFMVGFEMLGMPQRDLTPETTAERLRSLSERHFRLAPQP